MAYKTLRLILGDQLNIQHSWFSEADPDTLYLIAELHQEANYVVHHIQKLSAFFSAMQAFSNELKTLGHNILHLTLDQTQHYDDLPDLLSQILQDHQCQSFQYQQPDEYRVSQQLLIFTQTLSIPHECVDTEHFFLPYTELENYFTPAKHNRMESFYRKMRKAFNILMEQQDKPLGGQWNFDSENRKKLKKSDLPKIPAPMLFENNVEPYLDRIEKHKIPSFGKRMRSLTWPIDRKQSLELIDHFCVKGLPNFGCFQDAMTDKSDFSWSLYHSRLSFALNTKLISPIEVINAAITHFEQRPDEISLAQIEGFVRQILGWREYVRGMYWVNMPYYAEQNYLDADKSLPAWFWTGKTKMNCMRQCIHQSLDHAYAHHIQRLMITGNFSLLTGIQPDQVDAWYLGIYIDALEWVELPNTRGMALFADGGWIATKPYAASGNYINKMSDYCGSCEYSVKEKLGPNACPFNSLYWNFIGQHESKFRLNPRLSFVMKQWSQKSSQEKQDIHEQANLLIKNIEQI